MRKSMNIFCLFLMILGSTSVNAQQFSRMDQLVDIAGSGSAEVRVQVEFSTQDTLPSLQLACAFENISDIRASWQPSEAPVPVEHLLSHGVPYLKVNQPVLPGKYKLAITVQVDEFLNWDAAGPEEFGTYTWEMMYENNQPISVDSSSLTIKLPEGWNFHRILSSAPKFKKKDPKPPYTFSKVDTRATVMISRAPLDYRDQLGLEFSFKKEKKGSILIYVGLVIAILYLYYFRDLILKHRSIGTDPSDETRQKGS